MTIDRKGYKGYVPDLRIISVDPAHLGRVLYEELMRVSAAIDRGNVAKIDPIYVTPDKKEDGDLRYGKSPLDLGSGDGVYLYNGTTWVKLG